MQQQNRGAGAVAFVRNVKNPIKLARLVMERTEHVLLAGDGADLFAEEAGVELCDNTYFYTDFRWKQLEDAIAAGRVQLDHTVSGPGTEMGRADPRPKGTVGAVACDAAGHLAAATSTGGMTNKRFGRVGDTAIIAVVRSGHRAEAFAALRHAVDATKFRAPIWKEEFYPDGTSEFVQGCCIDPDQNPPS